MTGVWQPEPDRPSRYIGGMVAQMLVGPDDADAGAIADVISTATKPCCSRPGGTIATAVGTAYSNFLDATAVDQFVSVNAYNMVMNMLTGATRWTIPPAVLQQLPALVGTAYSNAVNLLSAATRPSAQSAGTFIGSVLSGLADVSAIKRSSPRRSPRWWRRCCRLDCGAGEHGPSPMWSPG